MKQAILRKVLVVVLVVLFASTNIIEKSVSTKDANKNDCITNSKYDVGCYGFVVSPIKCENLTFEDQINCKIRQMINDLLREQISVFWTTTSSAASIKEISDTENGKDMLFEKGTFVIPFTGDTTQDAKLIAIVYDYNQSSEIDENNSMKIPVYELMGQLNIQAYQLSETKIAQYKDYTTGGEIFYLEIAKNCGFLTFEFLEDTDLSEKLDTDSFNVIIWPSLDMYHSLSSVFWKTVVEDVKYNVSNTIRKFVATGGGYIGSCYGAYKASCGVLPAPVYLIRRAYDPKLTSVGVLAISDILTVQSTIRYGFLGKVKEQITNDTNPVTYGVDDILTDYHYGGPKIVYVGKNSQVIARFFNTSLGGTPSWISSTFGRGKVVLFSSHPEIAYRLGYYYGRTIITNALHYTTSKGVMELSTTVSVPTSFIREVWEKTGNLMENVHKTENVCGDIKLEINETIGKIKNLDTALCQLQNIIRQMADEKNIDINESSGFLGYGLTLQMLYDLDIFIEYFENTTNTLNVLEKIYSLLKNDTNFIQQFQMFKANLFAKINEAEIVLSKSQNIKKDYEKALLEYQQNQKMSKLKEYKIKKIAYELKQQITMGFLYTPQTYLDSLKFLRESWYRYEAVV